uniref:Sister chromatid cohesion 1 protein 3 n=1 Tax=Cajanus cajan TaxID=3821 RepID=A0A151QRC3_CAJCA|nr:Sister chromatid cohesion 1 protein 3 [Cajanus cajan]
MFYSHTFLARKGPLSTVWIAAHLQHRLKKSHYAMTDIPSTVLRIMDPGVPIALRMSGHLLLGVVRIYSKKVEYFFQDCKEALTGLHKALDNLKTTHQEEARPVPFSTITLPETFDLDAQNIDLQLDHDGAEDLHLRNPEDITLTDQVPVTTDYYVTVSFDEVQPYSLYVTCVVIVAQSPPTNVMGAKDHGPSTQEKSPTIQHSDGLGPNVHSVPHATPVGSVERIRGPYNDINPENSPLFSNLGANDSESNRNHDQTVNENDHVSETFCDLVPEGIPVPSQLHFNPPTPPTSQGGTSNAQVHDENIFPPFELDKSPPVQQPQRRARKRIQFFDESIVLTNGFMRKALNNPRDILRKRKDLPSSSLGTWKLNNSRRKEHIFDQPLLTGVCKDLLDISKSEYVRSRPHLVISEEYQADASMAETLSPTNQPPEEPIAATIESPEEPMAATNESPEEPIATTNQPLEELVAPTDQTSEVPIPDTSPVDAFDMEIEHRRNVAVTPLITVPEHDVVEGDYMSADKRDDLTTMASPPNTPVVFLGTNIASERMQTLHSAGSPSAYGSETMQTPDSDAYHLTDSAKTDVSFKVLHTAQYLEKLSTITPILEEPAGDLSLNKILKGRTKHVAARMFFEVLVLKTNDLLDVQQEQPYDDVTLKLAPSLQNAQS